MHLVFEFLEFKSGIIQFPVLPKKWVSDMAFQETLTGAFMSAPSWTRLSTNERKPLMDAKWRQLCPVK